MTERPFDRTALRRRLLGWFRRHARDLPWRHDRDPYRIWVSEVMLQQTQVATVIPYFHRFLERFPTVADLARAPLHDVLRLWEGLGYYRRARDLRRAAELIVERHQGQLPGDADQLRQLPGFGRYTANAVLSQAYEVPLPILEANSRRVLCRLFAERDDPRSPATERRLWEHAQNLLPARRVGDFNQALMELGALICIPQKPRCEACPVAAWCRAFQLGLVDEIPVRSTPPRIEEVREVAVVVRRRGQVLLVQRPATGRWAMMWEFPRAAVLRGQSVDDAAQALLREIGVDAEPGPELSTIRHGVTRFRITLVCLEAVYRRGRFRPGAYPVGRWLTPASLADFPVSRPQRALARLLVQSPTPPLF